MSAIRGSGPSSDEVRMRHYREHLERQAEAESRALQERHQVQMARMMEQQNQTIEDLRNDYEVRISQEAEALEARLQETRDRNETRLIEEKTLGQTLLEKEKTAAKERLLQFKTTAEGQLTKLQEHYQQAQQNLHKQGIKALQQERDRSHDLSKKP